MGQSEGGEVGGSLPSDQPVTAEFANTDWAYITATVEAQYNLLDLSLADDMSGENNK